MNTPASYYNEIDPQAAQWLRNLIQAGLIAPGEVDNRSITDVTPADLRGFTQCHFFAGIGVWSHALRAVGWNDERPVWTGSCPCQPFSEAGKGGGTEDVRHLWPVWQHLIEECRPGVVFGEQVEAALRFGWLDLVQADLEKLDYAVGAVVLPAAGYGAPHGRHRLWFVADANHDGRNSRLTGNGGAEESARGAHGAVADRRGAPDAHALADAGGERRHVGSDDARGQHADEDVGSREAGAARAARELGDASGHRREREGAGGQTEEGLPARPELARELPDGLEGHGAAGSPLVHAEREGLAQRGGNAGAARGEAGEGARDAAVGAGACPGPTGGFWADAEWLACVDGKARPVEPGSTALVDGATSRVVRLRAYGNAIVSPVAQEFIKAFMQS